VGYNKLIEDLQEIVRRCDLQGKRTLRRQDVEALKHVLDHFDEDMPEPEKREIGFARQSG
jgi:hypothetical protein